VRGPVFTGQQVALGRTAVLDTGRLKLVVSESRCEPLDLATFRFVGIEPYALPLPEDHAPVRPAKAARAEHP
jgi:microcystin degradation protein MlrC